MIDFLEGALGMELELGCLVYPANACLITISYLCTYMF